MCVYVCVHVRTVCVCVRTCALCTESESTKPSITALKSKGFTTYINSVRNLGGNLVYTFLFFGDLSSYSIVILNRPRQCNKYPERQNIQLLNREVKTLHVIFLDGGPDGKIPVKG